MGNLLRRIIHRVVETTGFLCSDGTALRILYLIYLKKHLNLKNPVTFNEKLQWLKLYYRPAGIHMFVDKSTAKEKAMERCPELNVIPTIGLWEDPADIDFDILPEKFILKPTHGGGGNVWICRDIKSLDKEACLEWCRKALRTDIYRRFREFPYRDAVPAILAEPLIGNGNGTPADYKFFCFDGKPLFLKIDSDRFSFHRADYMDMSFSPLDIQEKSYPPLSGRLAVPSCFKKMVNAAEKLSRGFPFVRIDLYESDGSVYFGEFTFYPRSGLGEFYPEDADRRLGDLLKLPL